MELLLSCGKTFPSVVVCAQLQLKGFRKNITNALRSITNQNYLPIFKTAHPYWERTELYSILEKEFARRTSKHGLIFFIRATSSLNSAPRHIFFHLNQWTKFITKQSAISKNDVAFDCSINRFAWKTWLLHPNDIRSKTTTRTIRSVGQQHSSWA